MWNPAALPRTFWLTVTNIVLGLACVTLLVLVASGVLCDYVGRWRRRHNADSELDRDMIEFFGADPKKRK